MIVLTARHMDQTMDNSNQTVRRTHNLSGMVYSEYEITAISRCCQFCDLKLEASRQPEQAVMGSVSNQISFVAGQELLWGSFVCLIARAGTLLVCAIKAKEPQAWISDGKRSAHVVHRIR